MIRQVFLNDSLFFLVKFIIFVLVPSKLLVGQGVVTDVFRDGKGNISSIDYYSTVAKKLQLIKLETFHLNGHISTLESFYNGLKNGIYKEFYDNGHIKTGGQYSNGNKSGLWTEYFREGGPMKMFYASENGKDGSMNEWYRNGEKKIRGMYSKDKKHGQWSSWYSNGVKESLITYNQGKKVGIFSYYYNNGIKKSEGAVSYSGQKEERCWDLNGNIQTCSKDD